MNRIAEYARKAINRLECIAREWAVFDSLTTTVNIHADLPAEELAPLFESYSQLKRLGLRFDPSFEEYMRTLKRVASSLDIDGQNEPHSDARLDTDESADDQGTWCGGAVRKWQDGGMAGRLRNVSRRDADLAAAGRTR